MNIENTRCNKTLIQFIEYMNNNPDLRFFQGVQGYFGISYLIGDNIDLFHIETDDDFWCTADNKYIRYVDMTDQHLSNLVHYFNHIKIKLPVKISNEINRRNLNILPYKQYFDDELENKIYGRNDNE